MRYLLWDHDGVLVDTEHWYFRATQETLRSAGVEIDEAQWQANMPTGQSLWHLADGDPEALRAERNRRYQAYLQTEDIEIPGVQETLVALSRRHEMAIVTTARRADFELIHRDRSLVEPMAFVLTVEDYPRSKPAPDPYLAALERFGAAPTDAVVIEDSARGLRAALAAGIDCIVVRNAFTASQDFSGARFMAESIRDVPALLNRL